MHACIMFITSVCAWIACLCSISQSTLSSLKFYVCLYCLYLYLSYGVLDGWICHPHHFRFVFYNLHLFFVFLLFEISTSASVILLKTLVYIKISKYILLSPYNSRHRSNDLCTRVFTQLGGLTSCVSTHSSLKLRRVYIYLRAMYRGKCLDRSWG